MSDPTCLCRIDPDGILEYACDQHKMAMWQFEHRVRQVMDRELDESVKELAGRSPTRVERKPGATGTFAIDRKAP